MWGWKEIDVASASAISARWGTEGFIEFAVERDATVTAFPCAYVYNQMVEKCLPLYKRVEGSRGEAMDWVGLTHALPPFPLCSSFSPSDFLQVIGGPLCCRWGRYVGWERRESAVEGATSPLERLPEHVLDRPEIRFRRRAGCSGREERDLSGG